MLWRRPDWILGPGLTGSCQPGWTGRRMARPATGSWRIGSPSTARETRLCPGSGGTWTRGRPTTPSQHSISSTTSKISPHVSFYLAFIFYFQSQNLSSELATCQKDSRTFIVLIQIRFYSFWCGWFQIFVVEIRITIIKVTFGVGTTTTAAPTTAAPTTVKLRSLEVSEQLFYIFFSFFRPSALSLQVETFILDAKYSLNKNNDERWRVDLDGCFTITTFVCVCRLSKL